MGKKMTYPFPMSNKVITKISQHEMCPYFMSSSWEKGHEGKMSMFTEHLSCARYFTNAPVLVQRLVLKDFSWLDSLIDSGEGI